MSGTSLEETAVAEMALNSLTHIIRSDAAGAGEHFFGTPIRYDPDDL
jgi:hypothetical protein